MTIKRKVILINLASSGVVSLLVATLMFAFQWFNARTQALKDLSTQAEIIAANTSSALVWEDRTSAEEILAALSAKPEIISAGIFLNNGELFTHYGQAPQTPAEAPPRPAQKPRFYGRRLDLSQPIILRGEQLGTLLLEFDFHKVQQELMRPYGLTALMAVGVSILVGSALSAYFHRLISTPISRLVQAARLVTEHKDYSLRVPEHGDDELGILSETFNEMLEQIHKRNTAVEELHRQLLDSSHRAGMAEVASGVIHNIGNVLNSINISANLVGEKLARSQVANVQQLARLLQKHSCNLAAFFSANPIGKELPDYLGRLAERLEQERQFQTHEILSVSRHVEHIKAIVARQQSYAKCVGVTQTLKLPDLIEDALQLNAGSLSRHQVQIVREFDPNVPEVEIEKHKVLQILINLIRNAKQACEDAEPADKRLLVRLDKTEDHARIAVIDNGVGIPAENLTLIFHHGFTTRENGHGFGLHNAALLAREIGGRLLAESSGPRQGAAFTLEIPLKSTRAAA